MTHNNKKTKTVFQPTLLAVLIGSALIHPVMAEQASDETKQQEEATLEVIQVTARKTAENLQDVPVAVTSLGAADISERGLASVIEVAQFSPNTTLQQSRGTNSTLTAFIRGVVQENPLFGY